MDVDSVLTAVMSGLLTLHVQTLHDASNLNEARSDSGAIIAGAGVLDEGAAGCATHVSKAHFASNVEAQRLSRA